MNLNINENNISPQLDDVKIGCLYFFKYNGTNGEYRFVIKIDESKQFYQVRYLYCGRYNKKWNKDEDGMSKNIDITLALKCSPDLLQDIQKYNLISAIFNY